MAGADTVGGACVALQQRRRALWYASEVGPGSPQRPPLRRLTLELKCVGINTRNHNRWMICTGNVRSKECLRPVTACLCRVSSSHSGPLTITLPFMSKAPARYQPRGRLILSGVNGKSMKSHDVLGRRREPHMNKRKKTIQGK
eukprot:1600855-Rhodomonas_salina.3